MARGGQYKNFRVAVYIPAGVVERMKDPQWLQSTWETISLQLKVDKVYIETYRSQHIVDEQLLEQVKKFFLDRGVQVAGGIAHTSADARQFETFSYADPKEREYVKKISELTARHFDEIILDDFFFHMSKSDADIAAKGSRSWTQYRLETMGDVSRRLVLEPARAVNPKVKIVIKYPNWYEHFQGLGYDLDQQPKMFDGIYTGTETRDPVVTDQHLQQYESYQIFRYFENIKPGGNGGGWVDTFSVLYVDRYAEQLWDTMFAKAPEIMLFNWDLLIPPIRPGERDAWKDMHTSFDYDQMRASFHGSGAVSQPTMARVAGYSLEQVDQFLGKLGRPIGIKSYKPYQSSGEDFLHNYFGMIGIPVDLYPAFPTDAKVVLLTESAKYDRDIVNKIKQHLRAGKNVVITSGLLHALQGKGIEDIVELEYTDHKVLVRGYSGGFGAGNGSELGNNANSAVVFPEIRFLTNDAWPLIRGLASGNGFPILLMNRYSKGILFVWTIPENFNDLYEMPPPVVSAIKDYVLGDFPVRLDGPSKVSLFAYDNGTFIVESFLDKEAEITVSTTGGFTMLKNLVTGEVINGQPAPARSLQQGLLGTQRLSFRLNVKPHSYRVFMEAK
ncbi:MAG TPA: hypothetical protein DCK93_08905 [Blastocatellia bacterium]|nr:hypothetical protein [Blastocatellia bacterium]HAF23012.1 hypothetical protein [Blastocatellia bacterium]